MGTRDRRVDVANEYAGLVRNAEESAPWPGKRTLTEELPTGGGAPLPDEHRQRFESSLGTDLGSVRLHSDGRAADFAEGLGARAVAVGADVFFGANELSPGSRDGDLLLAHEVAHTVQQRGASPSAMAKLEVGGDSDAAEVEADHAAEAMVAGAPARVSPSGAVARRRLSPRYPDMRTRLTVNGAHAIDEAEITQVLGWLRELNETDLADTVIQIDTDGLMSNLLDHVDRAERRGQFRGMLGRLHRARARQRTEDRIRDLSGGGVTADEAHEILTTLGDLQGEQRRGVVFDMQRRGQLNPFLAAISPADRSANARLVADIERLRDEGADPMGGTHVATAREAARVNDILTPGVRPGQTFRDVVGGRSYRADIEAALETVRRDEIASSRARLAAPLIPGGIAGLHGSADQAKISTDLLFGHLSSGPALRSTGPHPNLVDRATQPPDVASLVDYLIHDDRAVAPVHDRHDATLSDPTESGIIAAIVADWSSPALNPARFADLQAIDQAWLGDSGGGVVRVHPRQGSTPAGTRRMAWTNFQTIIHEYLHTITHSNYDSVARSIGGFQEGILIEGVTSLMTDKVWNAIFPGEIRANAALRASVELGAFTFDPSVIPPIDDVHYNQITQAREIERTVGADELKAAYFLGHTEMIGVGPQHATALARGGDYIVPAAGIATVADVAAATGAPVAEIARDNGLAVGDPVRAGQRLRVDGIRIHNVRGGAPAETEAEIARLNHVTVAALHRANPDVPAAMWSALPAGRALVIPVH